MRIKRLLLTVTVISLVILSGCGSTDSVVNDYSEQGSEVQQTTEYVKGGERYVWRNYLLNKPEYIECNSDIRLDTHNYLDNSVTDGISLNIRDIRMDYSINGISEYAGYDESEFLEYLKDKFNKDYVGSVYKLQDDGTIIFGEDIATTIVLSKQIYTNTLDVPVKFSLKDPDNYVAVVNADEYYYYNINIGLSVISDKIMESDNGMYTFQPGESLEMVMLYIYPEESIDSYKVENGRFMATKTSAYDYNNMYLVFNRYVNESNQDKACFARIITNGVVCY